MFYFTYRQKNFVLLHGFTKKTQKLRKERLNGYCVIKKIMKARGYLGVMDIEAFTRREKMLKLREELLAVEEDRLAECAGTTLDELNKYMDGIIDEVEMGKESLG
ncbi:MAG: hypothetical protein PHC92_09725 [Syntrophomonadaceae bacterium]|nr:hypothetical protein [Syntrophomonadaceae bacterium]